jgi:hypothetical protein
MPKVPSAHGVDHEVVLRRYLDAFDAGEMEEAAAHFAADGEYVRQAFLEGESGLQRFVGRDAILDAFVRRGKRPSRHHLRSVASTGGVCLAEGDLVAPNRQALFLLSVSFDDRGRISRYVAATIG